MTRRDYYNLCTRQPTSWLQRCVRDPGPYMTARHVALIRLALRNREFDK